MKKRTSPSDQIKFWEERARLLRLISHPVRLLILNELSESSRCVKDLNALVDIKQPNLSQHIAVLRRAKLVGCYHSGSLRCYFIQQPTLVGQLVKILLSNHAVRPRSRESVLREARDNSGGKNE